MADKEISSLPAISAMDADTDLAAARGGRAYRLSGAQLLNFLGGSSPVVGGSANFVRHDAAQALSVVQQHQAQKNIGVTWQVNPNLLINYDFRAGCLVDQRQGYVSLSGMTVYNDAACTTIMGVQTESAATCVKSGDNYARMINGSVSGYVKAADVVRGYVSSYKYTVDQWMGGANAVVTIDSDSITISAGAELYNFKESSFLAQLIGKTVTISALFTDGSLLSKSCVTTQATGWTNFGEIGDGSKSIRLNQEADGRLCFAFLSVAGCSPVACKLELGDTQTLAHQDSSGNWVLNEVPSYADTLRECQRYFVRFGASDDYHTLGVGLARDTTYISIPVALPVQMRTRPTVSISGNITLRQSDMTIKSSAAVYVDAGGVGATLLKIATADLTAGDIWEAHLPPQNYLSLSAEL